MFAVLSQFDSQLKNVENAEEFFNNMIHIDFEKADIDNDIEWFDNNKDKYGDAMNYHMKMTCFEWNNYKKYIYNGETDTE